MNVFLFEEERVKILEYIESIDCYTVTSFLLKYTRIFGFFLFLPVCLIS